jgi:phage RecT family recombinase
MPDDGRQIVEYSPQQLQNLPFTEALEYWTPNLSGGLPDHIPVERFKRVLVTAVSTNSELARADRRSLFNACARCAHDGLYPDGREAALVVYNTKVKKRMRDQNTGEFLKTPDGKYVEREYWAQLVQYMPMIAGIRKRMRNTGQVLSADAHVVYAKDKFHRMEGDDAKIVHEPAPLGQDRGDPIGAYAIIKLANGEVLREVMRKEDIEHIRTSFSKAPNSPAWTKTPGEMWKKTVLRRCSKAAPSGSDLDVLLNREEEIDRPDEYTPLREIPARPDPRDYMIITDDREGSLDESAGKGAAESAKFEVIDSIGETHEYPTEEKAIDALWHLIANAKALPEADGLIENNPAFAAYPLIIESYKDKKDALSNPGNRQDRPAAAAHSSDPAPGSTASADTGQTEHPEEQGQPSTSTERRSASPVPQTENTNDAALRDEPKSLAVPVIKPVGGKTDCEAMKAKMLEVIAGLTDPADTARNGRFAQQNRASLQVMRELSVDAWSTVQSQLEERDRQLRGGAP